MAVEIVPVLSRDVFATYGYFVVDGDAKQAILIDPGAQPGLFKGVAAEHGWTVRAILLTHGHFDHTGAVDALRAEWDVPVMAHEESARYLEDVELNLSEAHGRHVVVTGVQQLRDGEVVSIDAAAGEARVGGASIDDAHAGGVSAGSARACNVPAGEAVAGDALVGGGVALSVLHVPGHTDDSCVFYCREANAAFVGDTVYEGGPGLTVFPTGNPQRLRESIEKNIFALPDETMLLSGHSLPLSVADLKARMRG